MDNRIFNVNGKGCENLQATIELVFKQTRMTCDGWSFSKKHGLILHWCDGDKINKLPSSIGAEEATKLVWAWLQTDEAGTVESEHWDSNYNHDGHNGSGWRVYCEDWGHVDNEWSAICAIKPVYLWYGK